MVLVASLYEFSRPSSPLLHSIALSYNTTVRIANRCLQKIILMSFLGKCMQFKVVNKNWDGRFLNGFQKAPSIQHMHFALITINIK